MVLGKERGADMTYSLSRAVNSYEDPTPDWVPDEYGFYWLRCATVYAIPGRPLHPRVPSWYTNRIYDSRTGETCWQHFVRASGFATAVASRQAFLTGFQGVRGTRWCGMCYFQKRLMDLGEVLGYPDAYAFCNVPETHGMSGYGPWLYLARYGGPVLVQMLVHGIEAMYPDLCLDVQMVYQEISE